MAWAAQVRAATWENYISSRARELKKLLQDTPASPPSEFTQHAGWYGFICLYVCLYVVMYFVVRSCVVSTSFCVAYTVLVRCHKVNASYIYI